MLNMLFHCSNAAIYGIIKSNTGKNAAEIKICGSGRRSLLQFLSGMFPKA